jgi:hypothetical protein
LDHGKWAWDAGLAASTLKVWFSKKTPCRTQGIKDARVRSGGLKPKSRLNSLNTLANEGGALTPWATENANPSAW